MTKLDDIELYRIDPRSLTPKQWDAVKRIAIERAHAARVEAFRDTFGAIRAWLGSKRLFPPILRNIRLPLGASLGRS